MTTETTARTVVVRPSGPMRPPIRAYPRHHPLDMRDRRLGKDPMAEIEDEGAVGEGLEHGVDRAIERRPAGQERERIEVALNGDATLDMLARKRPVDAPIEADRIHRNRVYVARQLGPGAPRKPDHLRVRH